MYLIDCYLCLVLIRYLMLKIHLIGWNLFLYKGKQSFFEKRVGEYANIANSDVTDNVFSTDADF